MSKFLYFEPEPKDYRKTSTLRLSALAIPEERILEGDPSAISTDPPTTSRAESINRAYGTPTASARLRRRRGGEPRYRRIRPNVVSGQERIRASRTQASPVSTSGTGMSGGGSGGY
jgi:hypothetical protein